MPPDRAALALFVLIAWVAVWWLAVRVVFGRRFGVFEWVPVATAAFAIPAVITGQVAPNAVVLPPMHAILCWGSVGVLIDVAWVVVRITRRSVRQTG